jgi:hypothetical protein
MILWNALTHPPLQAGSTWGVADGILKGGIGRPYATIAVDPWWYLGATNDGFTSTGARIIAHEIINSIGSKLEVAPYNCAPLTADPSITRAGDWEASRLAKITSSCYTKYTSTRTK